MTGVTTSVGGTSGGSRASTQVDSVMPPGEPLVLTGADGFGQWRGQLAGLKDLGGCHVITDFGLTEDVSRMLAISYIAELLCHLMQG